MNQIPQLLEDLLGSKGYLSEEFKTGTSIGYWLRELQESYETCRNNAHYEGEPQSFSTDITAQFDNKLDKVYFSLHFSYDPDQESLGLVTLTARLGSTRSTHFYDRPEDLPAAQQVYESLCRQAAKKQKSSLSRRVTREHLNRENFYHGNNRQSFTDGVDREKFDDRIDLRPAFKPKPKF